MSPPMVGGPNQVLLLDSAILASLGIGWGSGTGGVAATFGSLTLPGAVGRCPLREVFGGQGAQAGILGAAWGDLGLKSKEVG